MAKILHKNIGVANGVHIVPSWSVADAAALAALTPAADDVMKAAYQQDTADLYLLVDHSPVTWKLLSSASIAEAALTAAQNAQTAADTSALFWEWNGVDLTQFDPGCIVATNMSAGDQSGFLSVVADSNAPYGNVLRVSLVDTWPNLKHGVRLIAGSFPLRYRLEFEFKEPVDGGQPYFGFVVMGNDVGGKLSGYAITGGTATGRWRYDAPATIGGIETANAGTWGNALDQSCGISVMGVKRPGVPVKFLHRSERIISNTTTLAVRQDRNAVWSGEPAGAAWNDLACDRAGIVVRGNTGDTTLTWDILSLRFYAI